MERIDFGPPNRPLTDAELRQGAPAGYRWHGRGCLDGCTANDLHAGEIVRHLDQDSYPVIGSNISGKRLITPDHHIVTRSPKEKEKLKGKYAEASMPCYVAGVVISTKPPTATKWFILNWEAPRQYNPDQLFQVTDEIDRTRWFPRHFSSRRDTTGKIVDTRVGVEEPKLFHIKTLHKMPWEDQARAKLEDDSLRRLLDKTYEICGWRDPPVQ